MKWFRAYTSLLRSRKVKGLSPTLFRKWVYVLCVAASGGEDGTDWDWGYLPPVDDLAEELRMTKRAAATLITRLETHGLLDEAEDGRLSPHDWFDRQFRSDDVTARTRKHKAVPRNVPRNGPRPLWGTPPETETETETDRSVPSEQAIPAFRDKYLAAQTVPQRLAACIDHWPHKLEPTQKGHLGKIVKRLGGGQEAVMKLSAAMGAIDPLRYLEKVLSNEKVARGTGRSKVVTADDLRSDSSF